MSNEPTLYGLLNQYEIIGGPEEYGPESSMILIALWRRSNKLSWSRCFEMTNTDLSVQTGIMNRHTLDKHRKKLVEGGLINYTTPPKGKSRGKYVLNFELIKTHEAGQILTNPPVEVGQELSNPTEVGHEVGQISSNNSTTVLNQSESLVVVVDEADRFIDSDPHSKFVDLTNRLEAAYCELHGVLGMYVKQKEVQAMQRMISGGMPLSFIIQNMKSIYEKKLEEGDPIRGFVYYESTIGEAWRKELLKKEAAPPPVPPGNKQHSNKRTSYSPKGSGKPKLPVYRGESEPEVTDEEFEAMLQRAREREGATR